VWKARVSAAAPSRVFHGPRGAGLVQRTSAAIRSSARERLHAGVKAAGLESQTQRSTA
jgi:hypothetical protein